MTTQCVVRAAEGPSTAVRDRALRFYHSRLALGKFATAGASHPPYNAPTAVGNTTLRVVVPLLPNEKAECRSRLVFNKFAVSHGGSKPPPYKGCRIVYGFSIRLTIGI